MRSVLLTTNEAAHILGLSPFTVRRLLREGELPGKKVGKRQWRIRRVDLDKCLGVSDTPSMSQQPNHRSTRIEQLAAEQGVLPITDINQLLSDAWPEDESVEEFLNPIYKLRESSPAGSDF
jgi:excisionase family DNA binding protein